MTLQIAIAIPAETLVFFVLTAIEIEEAIASSEKVAARAAKYRKLYSKPAGYPRQRYEKKVTKEVILMALQQELERYTTDTPPPDDDDDVPPLMTHSGRLVYESDPEPEPEPVDRSTSTDAEVIDLTNECEDLEVVERPEVEALEGAVGGRSAVVSTWRKRHMTLGNFLRTRSI